MGTMEKKDETKIEKVTEEVAAQQKILEIPGFMDKTKKIATPTETRGGLKHIKVNRSSQNKWEILRKLDELISLIVSGEEPRSGEIRYILNQKDTSKSEKIRGVIKIK